MSPALNHAFQLSHGDYIQELDSDDVLAPDKIERQLAALRVGDSRSGSYLPRRGPLSTIAPAPLTSFATPYGKTFLPSSGFLRKLSENLHMQNANLAGEPRTVRGSRTLGHTPSL